MESMAEQGYNHAILAVSVAERLLVPVLCQDVSVSESFESFLHAGPDDETVMLTMFWLTKLLGDAYVNISHDRQMAPEEVLWHAVESARESIKQNAISLSEPMRNPD